MLKRGVDEVGELENATEKRSKEKNTVAQSCKRSFDIRDVWLIVSTS